MSSGEPTEEPPSSPLDDAPVAVSSLRSRFEQLSRASSSTGNAAPSLPSSAPASTFSARAVSSPIASERRDILSHSRRGTSEREAAGGPVGRDGFLDIDVLQPRRLSVGSDVSGSRNPVSNPVSPSPAAVELPRSTPGSPPVAPPVSLRPSRSPSGSSERSTSPGPAPAPAPSAGISSVRSLARNFLDAGATPTQASFASPAPSPPNASRSSSYSSSSAAAASGSETVPKLVKKAPPPPPPPKLKPSVPSKPGALAGGTASVAAPPPVVVAPLRPQAPPVVKSSAVASADLEPTKEGAASKSVSALRSKFSGTPPLAISGSPSPSGQLQVPIVHKEAQASPQPSTTSAVSKDTPPPPLTPSGPPPIPTSRPRSSTRQPDSEAKAAPLAAMPTPIAQPTPSNGSLGRASGGSLRPPPPIPAPRASSPVHIRPVSAPDPFMEASSPPAASATPSLPTRLKPELPIRAVTVEPSVSSSANPDVFPATTTAALHDRPKPPLPARKGTSTSSSDAGVADLGVPIDQNPGPPPPIPANRPILERPTLAAEPVDAAAPLLSPPSSLLLHHHLPPRLPVRSNTLTASRSLEHAPLPVDWVPPPPPPPPTRSGTLRVTPGGASAASSPRPIPRAQPSARHAPPLVSSSEDSYMPPPPPRRAATGTISLGDQLQPASSRSARRLSEATAPSDADLDERGESDEEDEDEVGGAASYGGGPNSFMHAPAPKSDDLPDPTMANRRPPRIRQPRPFHIASASGSHRITSFAVSGDLVAIGSAHLRVYDASSAERTPILNHDQKDTGLEIRVQDPKFTAICFRPTQSPEEKSRYLWCGSKDGHLWEVDLWASAVVTQTRSLAHTGHVTHILRYEHAILTLDETGKGAVYRMNDHGAYNINAPTQTLRIADRQTFVALVGHQLWTSSGPVSHTSSSSASAASAARGPTIRVYEPFAAGGSAGSSNANGRVLSLPDTLAGAVLAAAVIPSELDRVYLGHEGGTVSIWSRETCACLGVRRIATSAVIALVGVGNKLWAGNRKGVVTVYDVSTQPWTVTNLWSAHTDNPVLGFVVDLASIDKNLLNVYSWGRDDSVQGWDGLLAVDWIDGRLLERESEFCTYRELQVLICTWNMDAAKPEQLTSTADNAAFLTSVLRSEASPDVIVFGFQELIDLNDKKLQAKTLLFGKKKAKSSSNGDMSDKVSQRYRLWYDKLVQAVRVAMPADSPYIVVHAQNLVGLFTCVFIKASEAGNMRDVALQTIKRGMAGMYGNKGAIICRLVIDDSSLCFINCHLAAGQSHKAARNADLADILDEESRFPIASTQAEEFAYAGGGDGSMILDHDLCFLQGDLNYRIDLRRENVISSLRAGERAYLLEHDQLRKEQRSNPSFRLRTFSEAPIEFDPTYKYNRNSNEYDTSEKKRVPAWCDRILFRSRVPGNIEPLHYSRYEPTVSDHRPVSAGFSCKIRKVLADRRAQIAAELEAIWNSEQAPALLAEAARYYESF